MAAALAVVIAAALPGATLADAANGEPFAASQWGLRQVGADVAWDVTRGQGARVGIIDTGIDLSHSEMAGRVAASTRCVGTGGEASRCGGSAQDDSGHGTHVAGIVGAPIDGVGVAGVAPEATLLVVKALRADGSGEAQDVAAGIDWLIGQGVHVVNLSLAETLSPRPVQDSPLERAIRRAADAGAVVVLAAGNQGEAADGSTGFNLPAIVVGATDRNGRLAPYSQPLGLGIRWGMVAPGGDGASGTDGAVVSTYWFAGRRNAYAWSKGTSMAAPHVAGAAALLAAQGVRGRAAVDRLLGTAAPAGCGTGCRGLLDARAAVGAAAVTSPAPVASSPTSTATPGPPAGEPPPTTSAATIVTPPGPAPEARVGDPLAAPEPMVPEGQDVTIPEAPVERALVVVGSAAASGRDPLPPMAVPAVAVLLALTAAAARYGRRRFRADEEW